MKILGIHLLLDLEKCDTDKLDDLEGIENLLTRAAKDAGAKIVGKTFHKLDPKILQKIVEDEKTLTLVKAFNNTKVKEGQSIRNTLRHARELGEYVEEKYQKEIDKLKRPQSKETKTKNPKTQISKR